MSGFKVCVLIAAIAVVAHARPVFRPPAVPLLTWAPMQQKYIYHEHAAGEKTRYWDHSEQDLYAAIRVNGKVWQLLGTGFSQPYATQMGMPIVWPTRTIISYQIPNEQLFVDLEFINPLLTDDLLELSRPVSYVRFNINATSGTKAYRIQTYFAAGPRNVVNLGSWEDVQWDTSIRTTTNAQTIRMGSEAQDVLGQCGDWFMLDWGYLYIAAPANDTRVSLSAAALATAATYFSDNATVPPFDTFMPRSNRAEPPGLIAVTDVGIVVPGDYIEHTVSVLYDEIYVQDYFGLKMKGYWASVPGKEFIDVLDDSVRDADRMIDRCRVFDVELYNNMSSVLGEKYAVVASMAYRQCLAAIELAYNPNEPDGPWAFMKEISSDGDVNTMDVIFPSSPTLFEFRPEIIKALLLPVLAYANNETYIKFTDPFSPHQLGTYPICNDQTYQQELMPLENSGNMFLMLLHYMQRTNFTDPFFYPRYWKVLSGFARYMMETQLPNPPKQICTDDFAGPLRENANLAGKGVIALYAFHVVCDFVNEEFCDLYKENSIKYAQEWTMAATEYDSDGSVYTRLAYNLTGTWSTKYNMLWQKILGLDGPFENYDEFAWNEVQKYKKESNKYGFPMDLRHTYQKVDWMTWGSSLANTTEAFLELWEPAFDMLNDTACRMPFTDLFDTTTAWGLWFRARPVVGALLAPYSLFKPKP